MCIEGMHRPAHKPIRLSGQKICEQCLDSRLSGVSQGFGLKPDFDAAKQADDALRGKWQTVDYWSEDSRYEPRAQKAAEDLFSAVADPDHGVLACLKRFW
jgi:hypothetical protein